MIHQLIEENKFFRCSQIEINMKLQFKNLKTQNQEVIANWIPT